MAPERSARFGGEGGTAFDGSYNIDSPPGRINRIMVRSGKEVDAIAIGYTGGPYTFHGGQGGEVHATDLGEGEYVVRVEGRCAARVDQITFVTNKRKLGPYGGGGGDPFEVDFRGKVLLYVFGRAGGRIDQIGFGYGEKPSAESGGTVIVRSDLHGGTGGTKFDDLDRVGGALGKITSVEVRSGSRVDAVTAHYSGGGGGERHGGGGGSPNSFALDGDEYIVKVTGRSGSRVDRLEFRTNKGRVFGPYGGGGGDPFTLERPGFVVKSFYGRCGSALDAFGVAFENAKVTRVVVTKVDFDVGGAFVQNLDPLALAKTNLTNSTTEPQQSTWVVKSSTTQTRSTQTSLTIGQSVSMTVEEEVNAVVASVKTSFTVGFSAEESFTTGEEVSTTVEEEYHFTTTVPPNSSLVGTAIVQRGKYDVPWRGTAVVHYQDRNPQTKEITGVIRGVATSNVTATWTPQ